MIQKLTEQEVSRLKEIKENYDKITFETGQITLQLAEYKRIVKDLEIQKEHLETDYFSNITRDQQLAKELSEKYGSGRINIDSGEIITE